MHTWIEINKHNLINNYKIFCDLAGRTRVLPVLKSNAYGHGLSEVAALLMEEGCNQFGVNYIFEAEVIRKLGFGGRILVLGPVRKEPIDSNDRILGESAHDFRELNADWPSDFLASLQRAFLLSSKKRFQSADEWLAELPEVQLNKALKIWLIGRDPEQVDILLEDCSDTVSRVHLEIQLYPDGISLMDRSSNGVTILSKVARNETVLIGEKHGYKIHGQHFLAKHEWDVELDLAGNIYKLSDLIDLDK